MLALIDRNFQGFGKELFTDAGKYVIHFGQDPQEAAEQVQHQFCSMWSSQQQRESHFNGGHLMRQIAEH